MNLTLLFESLLANRTQVVCGAAPEKNIGRKANCEKVPSSHQFDESVWDVDLSVDLGDT